MNPDILERLTFLEKYPNEYNSLLDTTLLMYNEDCIYDGKVELCKAIKNRTNTDLKISKFFMDIFIRIGVFYIDSEEKHIYNNTVVFNPYHTRRIKKEYFKITDLYYIINNDLTYLTYQKMHRKEKLDEIFGTL
jgi:hypothetical protein